MLNIFQSSLHQLHWRRNLRYKEFGKSFDNTMIQRYAYQCWRHYDIRLVFINQNDVICKFKFCVKVLRWFQIKLRKAYKFKGSISFVKNLSESEGVYRSRATMLIKGKSKPLQKQSSRGVLSKKVFLKISQNSQENTCARVSFLIKLQACLQLY